MKWLTLCKHWLLNRYLDDKESAIIHESIPGVYTREYRLGITYVKVVISIKRLSVLSDLYEVERRVMKDNPEAVQWEKWVAPFHTPTKQLIQGASKRICSFIPENNILLLEEKEYRKVI